MMASQPRPMRDRRLKLMELTFPAGRAGQAVLKRVIDFVAELQGEGRHLAMWTQHFDKVDANRDGFLVRAELEAWRQAHRAERQAQRAAKHAQRFTEADLNKDGRLSKVEASEKMPRLVRNFAWMDDNRDGFLSREDLRPMRAR